MAFLGLGKKQKEKKPLTDPLSGNQEIAGLPPLDTSLQEDKGLPETPGIKPSDDIGQLNEKQRNLFAPESHNENPSFYQDSSGSKQNNVPQHNIGKDIELISSKLDYLKAAIDNLSQRLGRLEQMAENEQDQKYRW
jgi:hypothetical protein